MSDTPKKPYYTLSNDDLWFLETLINTPSPTGFEARGQRVWIDRIRPHVDTVSVDTYWTAVATINPDHDYSVVIEAHCDEITWFVNYIADNWIIHVTRNWWADHMVAPWMRVVIEGKQWDVAGVFWRPAIHTRKEKDTLKLKPETIFVDIWASSCEEVEELWVVVWSVIRYDEKFTILNKNYYTWRAFDNRAGWFMIAQVAKMIKASWKQLPFRLDIVNSVQEEIWLRWAQMISRRLAPDVAIITDVCHDTSTPHIDQKIEGKSVCGGWPVLTVWPAVHNALRDRIEKVALEHSIPFQRMAASYYTGTDTDAFAYSSTGVPSALVSLPLKYMHTPVETVHHDDIANTVWLLYEMVCSITPWDQFHYFPELTY